MSQKRLILKKKQDKTDEREVYCKTFKGGDTPQRVCMVLEYPTVGFHGSGVPHRGFAWFWGTPHSVGMVLGYPTGGLHGSEVPHRVLAWVWGTPQRVYIVLHKCLVFAVFWGEKAKAQTANPTVTKVPPSGC